MRRPRAVKRANAQAAGSGPARPLRVDEWSRQVPKTPVRRLQEAATIELARVTVPPGEVGAVRLKKDVRTGAISLVLRTKAIGTHRFAPAIRAVRVTAAAARRQGAAAGEPAGFRPAHLALAQFPKTLPKALRRPVRFSHKHPGKRMSLATNIFGKDDRYTFSDTAFPWSTCGRVDAGGGWGSGVMVGPRHMMTASHAVPWGPNNTAGAMTFTPLYFNGSAPFGAANVTTIYWWVQNSPPSLSDQQVAFDYVVCILDQRMGDLTGWMGSRGYDPGWDGGNYWGHVGYPNDLAGGKEPAFIGYQPFIDTETESTGGRDSYLIDHDIDVIPGQSGGPYFGWWGSEPWPRVVAIQSGQQHGGPTGPNDCGGGNPLPDLISYALAQDP
jgi:V8-like Glu-specific endopeptidase